MNARREAKAQQVHQAEDVIGSAQCVDVVFLDCQVGLVVSQAVEHTGIDLPMLKKRVLVRDLGVKGAARSVAVFGINVSATGKIERREKRHEILLKM